MSRIRPKIFMRLFKRKRADTCPPTFRILYFLILCTCAVSLLFLPSMSQANGDEAQRHFDAGEGLFKKRLYEQAIAEYDKVIELGVRSARIYVNRGEAYRRNGQIDRAILDYNKALEIDPEYPFAYHNRGVAYFDKGQYDRALAEFNKALDIDSQFFYAYGGRGRYYTKKGQHDKAISELSRGLEINPRGLVLLNGRGNAYTNNGQYDLAIADFNKALEINPNYFIAYNNRGIAYKEKGEYERATTDFKKALEINPNYLAPKKNLGTITEAATTPGWQQVASWQGNGVKSTETFHVNSKQWRVTWNYTGRKGGDGGHLSVFAHNEDGSWSELAASQTGAGSGDSIMRSGPGDCYLEISSTSGSWQVVVEEKQQ